MVILEYNRRCYFPFVSPSPLPTLMTTCQPPAKKRCNNSHFFIFKPFFSIFSTAPLAESFPNNTNCSMCSVNSSVIFAFSHFQSSKNHVSLARDSITRSSEFILVQSHGTSSSLHTNSKRCCSLYKSSKYHLILCF